ncbi:Homeobox protein KNOX3 [Hordeum vulgare]|nr:Homeobox protein KNOX3 [Hordeum vulgare]
MVERFPGDGAAANGFGHRHLREDEARLFYEADYPATPDMRGPGSWRLSVGGVPVPPPPSGADRRAENAHICSGLPESSRNLPRYAPDSNALWTAYFDRCHANHLAATNGVKPPRQPQLRGAPSMVGRPRLHLGGSPRAHRGRQLAEVPVSTATRLLPPLR